MNAAHAQADPFDGAIKAIEAAYTELGHTMGWRFLCVSVGSALLKLVVLFGSSQDSWL